MANDRVQRHLAAIVAADVVGYSRLMGQDEEGTLSRLKAHRQELIDVKTAEFGGRIVKTTGDGILMEFGSVVDAVRCAVEIQRGMTERNADVAPDRRIEFRIGINLGDVIVEDGDIYGDGVNVAARLENLAASGGICVSRSVRDHIRDRLSLTLVDLGDQTVKNIARPVRVFGIQLIADAAVQRPTAFASPSDVAPLSVVVLPFDNLSRDPEQEYFADGIVEDLTTDLSRIDGSFVIARNTAFTYKGKPVDARQVGAELGVRYLLEGSVRRLGGQVRVNVQLIDTRTGGHVWADRFDGSVDNLFALHDAVTANLAKTLSLSMIEAAARDAARRQHPGAVDLVLRGRAANLRPRTRDNLAEARRCFEEALRLDPSATDAKVGLAEALVAGVLSLVTDDRAADLARARDLIAAALAERQNSAWGQYVGGEIARLERRTAEAASHFEAAVALDRNCVAAVANLGFTRIMCGAPDEAVDLLERAMKASPRDPLLAIWHSRIGLAHMLMERFDQAKEALEKSRALNPGLPWVHFYRAALHGLQGEAAAARECLAQARKLSAEPSSIARYREISQFTDAKAQAMREATVIRGIRAAGLPED